jgi:hypothetical protein
MIYPIREIRPIGKHHHYRQIRHYPRLCRKDVERAVAGRIIQRIRLRAAPIRPDQRTPDPVRARASRLETAQIGQRMAVRVHVFGERNAATRQTCQTRAVTHEVICCHRAAYRINLCHNLTAAVQYVQRARGHRPWNSQVASRGRVERLHPAAHPNDIVWSYQPSTVSPVSSVDSQRRSIPVRVGDRHHVCKRVAAGECVERVGADVGDVCGRAPAASILRIAGGNRPGRAPRGID